MTTKSKSSPFTLIRRSLEPAIYERFHRSLSNSPRIRGSLVPGNTDSHDKAFAKALISTVTAEQAATWKSTTPKVTRRGAKVIDSVARAKNAQRVGILDLSAFISKLPLLLKKLNGAQERFTFFEIQAPVPGGLIKKGDWYRDVAGYDLTPTQRKELSGQVLANQFFKAGRSIRTALGLDYLVGVTPSLVADISRGQLSWNLFSSSEDRILLVSTAELRQFATEANRSYEAFVANVLVSALLAAANPDIGFHNDTGCLFDYKKNRSRIIESVKNPSIEERCWQRISSENRDAAEKLVRLIGKL